MALAPDYGETPVDDDELEALLPRVRELLGDPVTKGDVYDLEQAIAEQVIEERLTRIGAGAIALDDLLSEYFLRDLHTRLYGEIWAWAGKNRTKEMTIGVDPNEISVQLRMSFDNIRYRGNAHQTGLLGNSESRSTPTPFESIHSLTGTGDPLACWPTLSSSLASRGRH